MISIVRGRSRDAAAQAELLRELARVRDQEIPRLGQLRTLRSLKNADFEHDKEIQAAKKMARNALYDDQYGKCCYCERNGSRERDHLEHFRPKTRANRYPGHGTGEGYWWLAWTWENLLFSCGDCNLQKSIQFPLKAGCLPLAPDADPPGGEHILLLDPATGPAPRPAVMEPAAIGMDPFAHIQFRPFDEPGGKTRWRPFPRNGSEYGHWTIEILGLDRPGLLERYEKHVKLVVERAIAVIEEAESRALATNDAARLRAIWEQQLRWLCDPEQEFVALSCDVLDHHFPAERRHTWQLPAPCPSYGNP